MLRFSGSGVTDVGLVRDHNEDSAFVGPYLALVADGVGGAAAGEIASATTTYAVSALALGRPDADPREVLREAVALARVQLLEGVTHDVRRAGMATTLTAVATDGSRVALAHVGDSRAYLVHEGRLAQLSSDHTYVQQLVEQGHLTTDQARVHPWKNVVLRALPGSDVGEVEVADVLELDVAPGDRLLLCSDGLSDLVTDDQLSEALALGDPQSAAATLVEEALAAGGVDNITCVVLDVVDGPRVVGDGVLLGAVRDLHNVVNPSAVQTP
ncbi:PP2C family protein-serine/threonine phosphatase [Nocardioides jensenii]|uniref:PP2C family protein-serine/threonine phosphatase n=1 Tax=Nocardioides jensenii TaxID=1843 RepID=UPI0008377A29|nr:protein phosphatase 2C domain-containing protein [Nocardioides jensenii]